MSLYDKVLFIGLPIDLLILHIFPACCADAVITLRFLTCTEATRY